MSDWTKIKAICTPEQVEQVSAIMTMLDSHLMIEDNSDIEEYNSMYGELIDDSLKNKTDAAVSVFIPKEVNASEAAAFARQRFKDLGMNVSVSLEGLNEEDWADNWKKYYYPVSIGRHITVVPEWRMDSYERGPDDVIIIMDPGMAFGTGTHETTRLCAALLEKIIKPGDRVVDVGTGSGILAICAAKLGASHVSAYDIDPMSVRVANENIQKNGVSDVILCTEGDLLASAPDGSDIVTANLTADIILRMAPDTGRAVKSGGYIVLSGIIDPQCKEVIQAMEAQGFDKLEELHENDWTGLQMTRK